MAYKNREDAREYQRRWYAANREKQLASSARWKAEHPEQVKATRQKYVAPPPGARNARRRAKYAADPVSARKYANEWQTQNHERVSKYRRNRARTERGREANARAQRRLYQTDPHFRLRCLLRKRIHRALSGKYKTASAVALLGCTIERALAHIESQWTVGMSWETQGKRGWHIDHIVPLSRFDLTDTKQLAQACHYTNLQPLWWCDNLEKGNR